MSEHWSWNDPFMPPGEPFPGKTYRADGWAYKDFPRTPPGVWDSMMAMLGDDAVPMTLADYGKSKRGQLLISPAGGEKLMAWVKTLTEADFATPINDRRG